MKIQEALVHWANWKKQLATRSDYAPDELNLVTLQALDQAISRLPERLQMIICAVYAGTLPTHEYVTHLGIDLHTFYKYQLFAEQLIQRTVFATKTEYLS